MDKGREGGKEGKEGRRKGRDGEREERKERRVGGKEGMERGRRGRKERKGGNQIPLARSLIDLLWRVIACTFERPSFLPGTCRIWGWG